MIWIDMENIIEFSLLLLYIDNFSIRNAHLISLCQNQLDWIDVVFFDSTIHVSANLFHPLV